MKRILVLRGGALGDFIVTLPALVRLRQRWPDARIELAGNATAARLALRRGLIDAVHSQHEARWSGLHGDAAPAPEFAAWLSGFDLVLNYWPDPDGALRRRFPLRAGQQFLSAPALPTRGPAAAHYCEPLRALGLETTHVFCRLETDRVVLAPAGSESAVSSSRTIDDPSRPIAIHPGSGSPRKNWPVENWRRLMALLPPPVSVILGETELERGWNLDTAPFAAAGPRANAPASIAGIGRDPAAGRPSFIVNASLEELVAHLSRCRLFLGHDSGISHLAAAAGARCVLLFGPTEPAVWAPPAPTVRVLRCGPDPASISVDEVNRSVAAALADRT